jgi:hypothetical protein
MERKIEGRIEVTGTRKKTYAATYDLMDTRKWWNLNLEAVNCTLWTARSGREYGSGARQTTR